LNKIVLDDKGATMILCFGLPPAVHEDESTRAVLSALLICDVLRSRHGVANPAVGIAVGRHVFCGERFSYIQIDLPVLLLTSPPKVSSEVVPDENIALLAIL
jgi:hypothetical protein